MTPLSPSQAFRSLQPWEGSYSKQELLGALQGSKEAAE